MTEKHTIAMTFLRKAMKLAQEIFQCPCKMLTQEDVAQMLTEYEEKLKDEIFMLLDKLYERQLI